jgi:lipopolysaccharide transport system ATP-binding protein
MSSPVIKAEGVSKKFIISHEAPQRYLSLRDVIAKKAKGLVKGKNGQPGSKEEFYALRNISFEINQGDRVGIIGRNGAGKSTLLKVLSRITEPSSGRITIRGRVASLLEVGTGFHPELTGRENIFLNGAILGMGRAEIRKKFDEIVEFAEVEKFLDTPVKRYSSGMYVRLAFAVAAHLEPEILVVDEVLAVGDAQFQKKCLGKMEDVSKNEGRTVLFVSHNMGVIAQLCQKAILLKKGEILLQGATEDVIADYLFEADAQQVAGQFINTQDNRKQIFVHSVSVMDELGNTRDSFSSSETIVLETIVSVNPLDKELKIGMTLQSRTGDYLSTFIEHASNFSVKDNQLKCRFAIDSKIISPNQYFLRVAAFTDNNTYDVHEMICPFRIVDTGTSMAQYEGISYGYFNLGYKILRNE